MSAEATEYANNANESLETGHRMRANTKIYCPRPGLAYELRRHGNDVVELDDVLLVNQTGGPLSLDDRALISTRRMH
jgi:hypothetical protein